jgi:hypothetical protein
MSLLDWAFVIALLLSLAQVVFAFIYVVRAFIKDLTTDKW